MFSSLMQALGVNSSFFIQFLIFLFFYPLISRFLFRPYFKLHIQREKETLERMKQVEKLKEKKEGLQKEYNEKVRCINEEFTKLYQQESRQIKEHFLKQRINNQVKTKKEYEEKRKSFLKEVKEIEVKMQAEVPQLAKSALDHLVS